MTDTATLVGRYATLKAQADDLYRQVKDTEYELITALRSEYPEEWSRWERGVESLTAEGVTIPVKRVYDTDKVQAEFGEERPDIIKTETKVVTTVDGRKLASMWKDAALARRLEKCLLVQVPKVSLK